jgi:hypothetical protein
VLSIGGVTRLVTAYKYAARDQAAAESMADAMAAFGYGEVGARPSDRRYLLDRGMGWEVVVVDDNAYPPGNIGLQQELAVQRRTQAIARAHGGFALGSQTDRIFFVAPAPAVLRHNPGSRPPIPWLPEIVVPPPGDLALAPDWQVPRPPRLDGLDAIEGGELIDALVRTDDDDDWSEQLLELLYAIMPEGDCQADTGPALTILARLLIEDAFTAVRRRDVYGLLIAAAGQYPQDVIRYADIVAATGSPPRPYTWSQQARDAVEAVVPGLLARWDIEPPANRLALATLAGLFRSHGQVLAGHVAALAAAQEGTRVGSCARVAHHLIIADYQAAARDAAVMSLWAGSSPAYDLENELLEPAFLAEAILAEQVEKLLS